MRRYQVTMQHDAGRVRIITTHSSAVSAVETACRWEGAPRRAVVAVNVWNDGTHRWRKVPRVLWSDMAGKRDAS